MNPDSDLIPVEEADANKRTKIMILIGIFIFSACALFTLAFVWFQPNQNTLFAKYFPSPTATRRLANTPAPTRTPIPNLTATQSAWIKPSQSPTLGNAEEAQKAFEAGMSYLESFASEIPDTPDINQPGDVYIYDIQFDQPEPVVWSYGWCTTTQEILEENFTHTQIEFIVNEEPVTPDHIFIQDTTRDDNSPCRDYTATIQTWPKGQHQLEVRVTFTRPTDDGWNLYPAGTHTFKYIVTVN
jgi:hypothetical protein